MFILGLQGEGQLYEVIPDLCDVLHSRMQEAREKCVAPGVGKRIPCRPPPPEGFPCFSLATLPICPGFANTVFMTEAVRSLLCNFPTLEAGSSKNDIWRMSWGLKELSEGSWSRRAQTPSGPISPPLGIPLPRKLQKGSLWGCHRLLGTRNGLPGGLSSLAYWVQLATSHLTA